MESSSQSVFVFDLDGVLWESLFDKKKCEYKIEKYNFNIIEIINNLFVDGNTIILQTARHWDKYDKTVQQIKAGGIKYDTLVMGNIPADYYINDKNLTPDGFINLYNKANLMKEKSNGK